ncbi:MAG: TlpA disulfide reductase family protein [Corynebacterium sp.]|uniref:TlpA family protein disulfide reductase n=1 Tax=Corynebacterium sp. TaxID=1720 RepID=UPI0026DF1E93|nr:TlpA disulfide reductase family protein [Corynebacterium sp.]MDO5668490.1 TlpA disulfide reductase family protein [Corynebacterium sp.]
MIRQLLAMVVIGVVLTIAVIAGAVIMLQTVNSPDDGGETLAVPEGASISEVGQRPDCPATGAGGVALDCLGGDNAAVGPEGITVVNVWAWWCGPCRDELPYFDEFAAANPQYTTVGVHADKNPANGAAMLDELGIRLPSYQDLDNSFAGTLGLPGVIPLTVVFDGEQQIALFPRTFASADEIQQAVDEAVATR